MANPIGESRVYTRSSLDGSKHIHLVPLRAIYIISRTAYVTSGCHGLVSSPSIPLRGSVISEKRGTYSRKKFSSPYSLLRGMVLSSSSEAFYNASNLAGSGSQYPPASQRCPKIFSVV